MADITTSTVDTSTSTANYPNSEQRVQAINNMYDANINAQKANLESSYQTNLANAQADKAKIADQYTGEKNNLAATYERQRRNNNLQASSNGLNTGAGSQMALAQQANYQSNMAQLGKAQAQAEADADRNISNLTLEYQSAVNSAVAQNDYQKAAALLDEYNNQMTEYYKQQDLALSQQQMGINQQNLDLSKAQFDYNKEYNQQQFDYTKDYNQQKFDYEKQQAADEIAREQAAALAQYGDFSGYAALGYTNDQVNNMSFAWLASNNKDNGDLAYLSGALDRAYNGGVITADQYKNIHGEYPANSPEAQAAANNSGGGGWSGLTNQYTIGDGNGGLVQATRIGNSTWVTADGKAYDSIYNN